MLPLFFEICTKTLSIAIGNLKRMLRILRHILFWLVIILWTSTVYLSEKTTGWDFILFNLIRLPLIMMTTYTVIYILLPKYIFKQKAYGTFAITFFLLFVVTTLLDRWLIGTDLIAQLLEHTGLTYTFFNEIPLIRNAFLLLSIIGLATIIRMFNFYQPQEKIKPRALLTKMDSPKMGKKIPPIKTSPVKPIVNNFLLKSGAITHKLKWEEILFLEKDENYVIYHTKEKRILERTTLSKLSPKLPEYFCRVHRSFIISLKQIEKIERDFLEVNGQKVPIGRTYRNSFLSALENLEKSI